MGGENLAHHMNVGKYDCYPGVEDMDDEDDMDVIGQSYDLHAGKSLHDVM